MPSRKSVSAEACRSAIRLRTSSSSAFNARMVSLARSIAAERSASALLAVFGPALLLAFLTLLSTLLLTLFLALFPALAALRDVAVLWRGSPAAARAPFGP